MVGSGSEVIQNWYNNVNVYNMNLWGLTRGTRTVTGRCETKGVSLVSEGKFYV